MTKRSIVNAALVLGIVLLVAVPLVMYGSTAPFAGADGVAADAVSEVDPGYEPWFAPLFESESSEVQSGLFALQAAAGGIVLGFVLGRLSGRKASRGDADAGDLVGTAVVPPAPSQG